jgi:serine/threonine protein kinase
MEYVPRGELFALWKRLETLPEQLVCLYMAELAMVLGKYTLNIFSSTNIHWFLLNSDFLHKQDIIYRDLKVK